MNAVRLARRLDARPESWLSANVWLAGLILWCIVVPAGRHHILIPLLALSAAAGAARMIAARFEAVWIRASILLFAAAAAVPVAWGVLRGTPGWTDVAVPLVGGPIAWFAISGLGGQWFAERAPALIAVGTIIVTGVLLALTFGVGRDLVQVLEPSAYGVRAGGASRANFVGATSLVATVPMLGSLLYDRWRHRVTFVGERIVVAGFIVGLLGVLVSGRQAAIGTAVLLPLLMFGSTWLGFGVQRRRKQPLNIDPVAIAGAAVLGAAVVGAALVIGLRPLRLVGDFLGAMGVGDATESSRINYSASVRSRQGASLLAGFTERPVLGWGAGAVSPEFHTWRGYEIGTEFIAQPRQWRAELSYHLLLFEGGVVAVAAYLGAFVASVRLLRRRVREFGSSGQAIVRSAVVGALALALAAAVDPLTRSVGQQWPLFLPLILGAAPYVRSLNAPVIEPLTSAGRQSS